ncbi:Tim44 domain-containing protein [Marinobacterium lutimaris]|uniref:Predicted lipid-binding transport protein, Tim44 family n=1 Tax=Marinobacterium lutimaris TaxID=568106 RepID=A0A1H6CC51_9GAMM|nr:TIM44-like domain-containing protein [Marinobacterium lutimaris]SEG70225.1 Predicted lipid-binding transport protein, Tim44 family [Marinobacterium lutimaris]
MRILTVSLFAFLLSVLMPVDDAHAKRLGGGFSLGKSYSAPKKTSPAPTANKQQDAQQTTNTAQQPGTTQRRPGMGGLMGGLLAGGLLGALFFGGAFEGIQIMDILIVAVIGFVLFKLFAGRRQAQQQQQAYAGAGPQPDMGQWRTSSQEEPQVQARQQHQAEPQASQPEPVADSGFGASLAEPELNLPEWFNKRAFLDQACSHFTGLQKAWDECNWEELKSYTTAELFEELKAQRGRFPDRQTTEVDSVMADLINFIDEKDHVIVSINFYGWLREDEQSGLAEFSEIWHLSRDMSVENADWFIVGIEQPK